MWIFNWLVLCEIAEYLPQRCATNCPDSCRTAANRMQIWLLFRMISINLSQFIRKYLNYMVRWHWVFLILAQKHFASGISCWHFQTKHCITFSSQAISMCQKKFQPKPLDSHILALTQNSPFIFVQWEMFALSDTLLHQYQDREGELFIKHITLPFLEILDYKMCWFVCWLHVPTHLMTGELSIQKMPDIRRIQLHLMSWPLIKRSPILCHFFFLNWNSDATIFEFLALLFPSGKARNSFCIIFSPEFLCVFIEILAWGVEILLWNGK